MEHRAPSPRERRRWRVIVDNFGREDFFLYGAATDSYVEHFGDGSLEAKKKSSTIQLKWRLAF